MPIGLLIGWLIGQIFVGLIISIANAQKNDKYRRPEDQKGRAISRMVGTGLYLTAFFALIGTFVELIVR